ncbi:WD40 repeat domain-containing protein [Aquifex sp.]
MRGLLLFLLIFLFSHAQGLKLEGAITDIEVFNRSVAVSTELGKVYLLSLPELKVEKEISLPSITDFMGEKQRPKVFSISFSPSGKKLLIVVEANLGKRDVFLYEDGKGATPLLKGTDVSEAEFLTEDKIVLATLGNEVWLYDLKNQKTVYRYLVFRFVFSDMELNREKNLIAWGDESGKVFFINPENGELTGVGTEGNKDKIFSLSFKGNRVLVGGRDKKAVVFNLNRNRYTEPKVMREKLDAPSLLKKVKTQFINRSVKFILFPEKVFESDFMVFAVALSPSGEVGAFTYSEEGGLKIFKAGTWELKEVSVPCYVNAMEFVDESHLLVGCIDGEVILKEVKP